MLNSTNALDILQRILQMLKHPPVMEEPKYVFVSVRA